MKATSKGQITLPAKWRKNFDTDHYLVKQNKGELLIKPLEIDEVSGEWEVIFNAERDNDGKGIPAKELAHILKKMN